METMLLNDLFEQIFSVGKFVGIINEIGNVFIPE
jgi:hypothetical protein